VEERELHYRYSISSSTYSDKLNIWIATWVAKVLCNSRTVTPQRSSCTGSCGVALVSTIAIVGTELGVWKFVSVKCRRKRRGKKVVRVEKIAMNDHGNETKHRRPPCVPWTSDILEDPMKGLVDLDFDSHRAREVQVRDCFVWISSPVLRCDIMIQCGFVIG
jgi:hypothetical protein